ncbi:hypothetical protein PROFUN_03781 [Planoprotostelium fungivorum]|uniref:Uncharacterized protein n=1 Tax=Planoprotostelium fungivorum TaxID=1890364 RepID=A0A2P6NDT1_9EUKA|nr:hypothetical protein PROFUN_03781 [Planoprotostelium fungivorum]
MSRVKIAKSRLDETVAQRFWNKGPLAAASLRHALESGVGRMLDIRGLSSVLIAMGLCVNKLELQEIMKYYAYDADPGFVKLEDFLTMLWRINLDDTRLEWANALFPEDTQLGQLLTRFYAEDHPSVVSGDRTEEHVRGDLLLAISDGEETETITITREAFLIYLSMISRNYPQEDDFHHFLQDAWKL